MIIQIDDTSYRIDREKINFSDFKDITLNTISYGKFEGHDIYYYSARDFVLFVTTQNEYYILIGEHYPAWSSVVLDNKDNLSSFSSNGMFNNAIVSSSMNTKSDTLSYDKDNIGIIALSKEVSTFSFYTSESKKYNVIMEKYFTLNILKLFVVLFQKVLPNRSNI